MKAQELPGADQTARGRFNAAGHGARAGHLAGNHTVKVGFLASNPTPHRAKGEVGVEDSGPEVPHGTNVVVKLQNTQEVHAEFFSGLVDADPMDRWPQREIFKERLEAYMARTQKSREEVATLLDRSKASLDSWVSRKGTMPPEEVKRKAAKLFGCPLSDFVDDPGNPPEGSAPESSEFDRFMLRTMGTDLGKMTEAQKQAAFNAWKAFSDGILGR